MRRILFLLIFVLIFVNSACAKHIYKEAQYQKVWCAQNNGILEYKNFDNSRVDCLTEEYAVEFDFAPKWAEAAGQALYYSILTKKMPAVVLISENPIKDFRLIKRAKILYKNYNIRLRVLTPKAVSLTASGNFYRK